MKTDLEKSVDKLAFLKETFSGFESSEYVESLPKHELLCCMCLLDSILLSIEQGHYACTTAELIRLYRSRERMSRYLL